VNARFDTDFSRVRVHTGNRAAESADVGEHIVFEVLAHELGHVVQQGRVRGIPMSGLPIGDAHDLAETAA
jgi:predicted Zn-dependent protease